MNNEPTSPNTPVVLPEKRAIIFVLINQNRDFSAEVEQELEACRRYAQANHFTVVEEVTEFSPNTYRVFLHLKQVMKEQQVNIIIFAPFFVADHNPFSFIDCCFELFCSLTQMGVAIHSSKGWIQDKYEMVLLFKNEVISTSPCCPVASESLIEADSSDEYNVVPRASNKKAARSRISKKPASSLSSSPVSSTTSLSTNVPLEARNQPLPHNGLFIRRNNAFGTKSTLGIKDLIEHGVLIEQNQIRFDDFVTEVGEQILEAKKGEEISVGHGVAAIIETYKAHEPTTHFLEIALSAAPKTAGEEPSQNGLPVNFVFVIDTSSSMDGEKLDTVKMAIRELYAQLRDTDILGIVTFDTKVHTALKATPKGQLSQERLTQVVSHLRANGATDINLGVLYGIDEISRNAFGCADLVNCLYLFSDGDPTSGETNWIKIRTNIAARLRGDLTLSCFGFGSDARLRELDALAGLTGGNSTFVLHPEELRLNLLEDLSRRDHLAAINLQMQIEIDPNITIWHLYGHDLVTDPATRMAVEESAREANRQARDKYQVESLPDLINQEKGIRIFAPDLAYGETYWVVLELQVPPGMESASLGTATVQYVDTSLRANRRQDFHLGAGGTIHTNTVLKHAISLWTSEVTFFALDDLYQSDRATAKARLSNHIQTLQGVYAFLPLSQFRDDQVTFRKLISLTENLGQPISWNETTEGGPQGYALYAMSEFGKVRGGFIKTRYGTF